MNETKIASPSTTIWGRVQNRKKLANGVYSVQTARHGGIVVSELVADSYVSDKAKVVIGTPKHGWYHFEEDCDVYIFLYENPDFSWVSRQDVTDGLHRWHEDYLTLTTEEIIAKREAEREAERRAAEEARAWRETTERFRQELLTDEWPKEFHGDGFTVTVDRPDGDSHDYPCTFSVNGTKTGNCYMGFHELMAILTMKKVA